MIIKADINVTLDHGESVVIETAKIEIIEGKDFELKLLFVMDKKNNVYKIKILE